MKSARFLCFLLCVFCFTSSVLAKDVWLNVRSKNFNLVGNASEKDIRGVATRLEQFREVFRLLLPKSKFDSFTPTTVVVFKSQGAYKPYLPVRQDGKADTGIAGYFQPGDDVNYITLSTEGENAETFSTIFHEYTHFMVENNWGKSTIPPWFNEGLAEYYETFRMENDQEVYLGDLQDNYLYLLQQSKMIPLEQFFSIDNYTLHNNGNHGRSVFYGQAWALMHYLQQGDKGAHHEQLKNFLTAILQNKTPRDAFQEAFQMDYAAMEKLLKNYVAQRSFNGTKFTLKEKLTFDAQMQTGPLTEAEADAYLGDLLLHSNRLDAAKAKLSEAIALDTNLPMAYSSLGAAFARQKNFAEARQTLDKAISLNSKNYLSYYTYGYALSREMMDESNMVFDPSDEKTGKMRAVLKTAIELNPNFPESYNLLGFVDLISNKELDEGVNSLRKALSLEPGNQHHLLILCQLLARQEKFDDARKIAAKLASTAEDGQMRSTAERIVAQIQQQQDYREQAKQREAEREKNGGADERETTVEIPVDDASTPEEALNKALNNALRKPQAGEKQILGYLTEIDCGKSQLLIVRGETQTFKLRVVEMQSVQMTAFTPDMDQQQVGCGVRKPENLVVVTFRPNADAKTKSDGEIVSLEFMPKTFKLLPKP